MNHEEILQARVRAAVWECAKHRQRLHAAWLEAVDFAALQGDSPDSLTETQVRTLDQLVFRFGRLQDALGVRLLPALMQHALDWREQDTLLDLLNRAEKRGMIPSADQWVALRHLRNQTAHEYPDRPEQLMNSLRACVAHTPLLEEIHQHLAAWAERNMPTL
ncbi:MAG: hypothetical protein H7837_03145 [Magnetococcus sp. MYC-9]